MTNFFKLSFWVILIVTTLFIVSCDDDSVDPQQPPVGTDGYFIVNEGGFGNGNASLSFYSRETGTVTNDIFYHANDELPLGDQAQSMTIDDTLGYVVVQNSGKIEVIDINTFVLVATIDEEITSPRYFVGFSDTKGYVSDWEDGFSSTVKVIDLSTHMVTKTIPTGSGTNKMMVHGNKLYAVNAGGFGNDNTLVIINTTTDEIEETIELGDNPNSLQADANGNIWVLCSGLTAYDENWNVDLDNSTKGSLIKLDNDGEPLLNLPVSEFSSPSDLEISPDGQKLYYLYNGGVYTVSISDTELPDTAIIDSSFYGLAIDPIDGTIIGCEAPSFSSAGNIKIYSVAGTLAATHAVGIAPNGCTFK